MPLLSIYKPNFNTKKSLSVYSGINAGFPSPADDHIDLDLDLNEPYIEIKEIQNNSSFIVKKAKTFMEEKRDEKKRLLENEKNTNLYKEITSIFPDADLTDVKEEND